jgi:uncharacterized protein (TIGR00369 family)
MPMSGTGAERYQDLWDRMAGSPFHTWAGMRLDRVDEGEVDVSLDAQDHHLNLAGVIHGGMIATLADTAMGLAYRTVLRAGASHLTSQLSVTFLAPGRPGTVTARATVVKTGGRVGYAEADVVDADGALLARATALFAVTPQRPAQ